MTVYLDLVILLNFLVDLLLLMGTNRLLGHPPAVGRAVMAAAVGGIYAGVCMLPLMRFLGGFLWRVISLAGMSVIAFGFHRSALRKGVVFTFLSMALGGIALGIGKGGFLAIVASAAAVCLMCAVGFRGNLAKVSYAKVRFVYRGKVKELTALRDTGNVLKDPVTGQSVLVAGADVAWDLLGLTEEQLRLPIETLAERKIPGLRLIPYRAVGQAQGMLLAVKMEEITVDGQAWGSIVAFAPQILGRGEAYQALVGGMV